MNFTKTTVDPRVTVRPADQEPGASRAPQEYLLDVLFAAVVSFVVLLGASTVAEAQSVGIFDGHADIGSVLHHGNTSFEPHTNTYTVTGSGDNLWFTADEMQFAWKRVHGDVALTAQVAFVGEKGNNHRKAALMVRQSLEANSPYADIARHGDGLTSLQFRLAPGDVTREVETPATAPAWIRLVRRGDLLFAEVGGSLATLRFSGATVHLALSDDFYVGLAVCSHDKNVTETAVFSHVQIKSLDAPASSGQLWSTLETVKVASSDRRVAYTAPARLVAPNWSRDGKFVTFEQDGQLKQFSLDPAPYPSLHADEAFSEKPTPVETGASITLSGTHGSSPDGSRLAFSGGATGKPHLYVASQNGSSAREVPTSVPAEWHSWSPDGRTLAFTGLHGGKADVYTVLAEGGEERCLTQSEGGQEPDFSPDARWIYFSAGPAGHLQLWRMHSDGSSSEQLISEPGSDMNPHPSPDGNFLVYLAVQTSTADFEQIGELRLMSLKDRKSRLLATLLAGPGTFPVPSWSPDSTRVAFISYSHIQ